MTLPGATPQRKFLGIEGSATRTVALLADAEGQLVQRLELGPASLPLLTDQQLTQHFRTLARALPRPDALGIGLAGGWRQADWERIRAAAAKAWPDVPCHATNGLEIALAAASELPFPEPRGSARPSRPGKPSARPHAQVLILSGTGSACYGRTRAGQCAKVGGWGHLLGDKGSGYELGLLALKAVVETYDLKGTWSKLGQCILRALLLNEPNDLVGWVHGANRTEVAELANEVFAAASQGDRMAADILSRSAKRLAQDAAACARKLVPPSAPVDFVLAGNILLKQPRFAAEVTHHVRRFWPRASVQPLPRESAWGAVELARRVFEASAGLSYSSASLSGTPLEMPNLRVSVVHSAQPSPTEGRNPRSMDLDTMSVARAVKLMLNEDGEIVPELLKHRREIEQVVRAVARAFRQEGRLLYVGAGTSGRLGVLDASECPPTFGVSPEIVQGIIAGGQPALWKSVEGAEDDFAAGGRAVGFRGVSRRDVVLGIAASGTTPFVWGALQEAKRRRATTVLVCFNPHLSIPPLLRPKLVIAPNLGPEVLAGSTRLKAGTATKLLLNLFTTLAMVRLGKVMSNLMVDMNPANVKLRDRAVRMLQALTGAERAAAQQALEHSGWVVKRAVLRLKSPKSPRAR